MGRLLEGYNIRNIRECNQHAQKVAGIVLRKINDGQIKFLIVSNYRTCSMRGVEAIPYVYQFSGTSMILYPLTTMQASAYYCPTHTFQPRFGHKESSHITTNSTIITAARFLPSNWRTTTTIEKHGTSQHSYGTYKPW